ncbi:MAG: CBS domain-containing protein [Limisphaerales bacterium]|jgi:CBS domain-containing protein
MSVSGLISQILTDKTSDIWSIAPDASVYDAIEMMAEKNAGALLVMEGEKLAGIISERDYSRKVILQGKSSKKTPVSEIMTTDPNTTVLGDTVEKCLRMMTGKRVRHIPVLDNGKVVGIVSIGDLVKWVISAQESTINHLENYISGGY